MTFSPRKNPDRKQQREQVQQIPIGELFPFKNHPFKVLDDESMTADGGKHCTVRCACSADCPPHARRVAMRSSPGIAASTLHSLPGWIPCLSLCATWMMMPPRFCSWSIPILQREHILPSERAFAYKMKLDAIKNQGARSDLTSSQVGTKLRADEKVAKDSGESRNQVQRFVRLTNLVPELLDMVDEKKISFNPAVELSYLDEKQQQDFLEAMDDFPERTISFTSHSDKKAGAAG